ncbi:PP2C family serine/threonine-protein phosphatase [Pedosphaera parvula]|nr:PP2C family serine/threonine-protein phosphatase [Pedosphaera parvula]
MWKFANASVRGSAHLENCLPCQDWSTLRVVGPDRNVVICALSDGAGSARFADEAAQLVSEGAIEFFARELNDHPDPARVLAAYERLDGKLMIQEQQRTLQQLAAERRAPVQDFACTLLVSVAHPKISLFFQIGDGCWAASRGGILGAVTWPAQGEFVGQTEFVTSPTAASSFQMGRIDGRLDFIVGITDGLERLALDMNACIPHPPFFSPLARRLKSEMNQESFSSGLHQLLESERVCARTDDDKSLVLMVHDE